MLASAMGCSQAESPARVESPVAEAHLWRDASADWGLDSFHTGASTEPYRLPEIMGGGVALFDCDGDGDLDAYIVVGQDLQGAGTSAMNTNRLWLRGPDGKYSLSQDEGALGDRGYGMGVAVADVDSDGDLDVYVTNLGQDRLFSNLGNGKFEDVTEASGIDVSGWSCSACFFDHDGDGDLDLYVTQYVDEEAQRTCQGWTGRVDFCGPKEFLPVADVLLENDGKGHFRNITAAAGIDRVAYAGLGVVAGDFNHDGRMDVYVANDAYPNCLWINQGDGTFQDQARIHGVALNMDGRAEAGMGIAVGDFDGDGAEDLFVTHLRTETNTLYAALPNGQGFRDASGSSQLGLPSSAQTGFGVCAIDVENDGDLDLLVANGRVNWNEPEPAATQAVPWNGYAERNSMFRNDGAGAFDSVAAPSGAWAALPAISRGLAQGDVDGDGDLDLLLGNLQGHAQFFENVAPKPGHWLLVHCYLAGGVVEAPGVRVTVTGDGLTSTRFQRRAASYLSSSAGAVHFGLRNLGAIDSIEVRWPDGTREEFTSSGIDRALKLVQGTGFVR